MPNILIDPGINLDDVDLYRPLEECVRRILTDRNKLSDLAAAGKEQVLEAALRRYYDRDLTFTHVAQLHGVDVKEVRSAFRTLRNALVTHIGFGGRVPVALYEQPDGDWYLVEDYELSSLVETNKLLGRVRGAVGGKA
jgi:hypothetical protein